MDQAAIAPWKRHLMLASALLLLASSLAHSFLGWRSLSPGLAAAGVADDLSGALAAGWHFGGVAMTAFATIVLVAWRRARRGDGSGLAMAQVIGAAYVVFGSAAFVLRSFAPFFMIFILPGAALLLSSRPIRTGGRPAP
jgi:hypothetical protein